MGKTRTKILIDHINWTISYAYKSILIKEGASNT